MNSSICFHLPKLELHAHLHGSISSKTLTELYEKQKKNKNLNIIWDSSLYSKETYTLKEFFNIFQMTYTLTALPDAVQIATEKVIEEFSKDNVIYLELRSTLRKEPQMTKVNYIEAMIKGVLNGRKHFPSICVKLLVSINRSESIESARENIKLAIEYSKKHPGIVVGVDISGNPLKSSFDEFINILNDARREGLKITVHCAEVVHNDEVKKILNFGPDRLGHCTCVHKSSGGDDDNWKLLLEKRIPVELCVTSNLKCKTVESISKHHFKLLFDAKHPITLATDDKGVFNTSLSKEFEIIKADFGLSEKELWQICYNTTDYIFANEIEKQSLKNILNQWKTDYFETQQ